MRPTRPARLLLLSLLCAFTWLSAAQGEKKLAAQANAPSSFPVTECKPLTVKGTYVLQNDVTAAGTCFSIQAYEITLDLNQHTVVYGNAPKDPEGPVYAIVGQACWDKTPEPQPGLCGQFGKFAVKNGTLRQAATAPPFSHAIRMGQGGLAGLKIDDLTIEIASPSSTAVYTTYTRGGVVINNLTIQDKVAEISNRHQIFGAAIRLSELTQATEPNSIRGVKLVGTPQGGVLDVSPGTIFADNDLALTGSYTNDFGLYLWGDRQKAAHNRITGQGRGIQIYRGTGATAQNNVISVFEDRVNEEYQGCQIGGSFGIQLETKSRNAEVHHNEVTAIADACDARAFRSTETSAKNGNLSHDNIYRAVRMKSTEKLAVAASFSAVKDATMVNDTLIADSHNVEVDWDGGDGVVLKSVRFVKGPNASKDYATFYLWPGANDPRTERKASLRVIDGIFENGASPDSYKMFPIGFEKWGRPAEYRIEWSQTFRVVDAQGQPLAGVQVSVKDPAGTEVFTGTTDEQGLTKSVPLVQFRRFNTPTGVDTEKFNYTATATRDNLRAEQNVAPTRTAVVELTLK